MEIQLFSERCSGSNYFTALLSANVPEITFTTTYGFKHWLPTREIDPDEADVFFVLLVRSAFSWLPSFYAQPWHVDPALRQLSFSGFIRSEWRCIWGEEANVKKTDPKYGTEMLHERCGARPFLNVLEMRSKKHEAWLQLSHKTERFIVLRFEDLTQDPADTLFSLCRMMSVQSPENIENITSYKGKPLSLKRRALQLVTLGLLGKKRIRRHTAITPNDVAFITDNLDWNIEASLGYSRPD